MKIEVNLEKKHVFLIVGAILVLAGVIGVFAVWDTGKNVYHPGDDVKVKIGSNDYSLQEAVTDGLLGGLNCIILVDKDAAQSLKDLAFDAKEDFEGRSGNSVCDEVRSGSICVLTEDTRKSDGVVTNACLVDNGASSGQVDDDIMLCCSGVIN